MQSSIINKIAKANQYAHEPNRVKFTRFETTFQGENDTHTTKFEDGTWNCSCHFFHKWGTCSHTMAVERILGVMAPAEQRAVDEASAQAL